MKSTVSFFRLIILVSGLLLFMPAGVLADVSDESGSLKLSELSPKEDMLNAVLPGYTSWKTAELSGKLRLESLPISPTVKIYMRKDSLISITVRASFLGEVGRIQLTRDSLLAINRMKRVYCQESLGDIKYEYPKFIGDIQAFLLGRVVVFKSGQLSEKNADFVDINVVETDSVVMEDKSWTLTFPKNRTEYDEFGYEYLVNGTGRMSNICAELQPLDVKLRIEFNYPDSRTDMTVMYMKEEELRFMVNLLFDAPRWDASAPAPVKINNKYRQVSISQFMKSF